MPLASTPARWQPRHGGGATPARITGPGRVGAGGLACPWRGAGAVPSIPASAPPAGRPGTVGGGGGSCQPSQPRPGKPDFSPAFSLKRKRDFSPPRFSKISPHFAPIFTPILPRLSRLFHEASPIFPGTRLSRTKLIAGGRAESIGGGGAARARGHIIFCTDTHRYAPAWRLAGWPLAATHAGGIILTSVKIMLDTRRRAALGWPRHESKVQNLRIRMDAAQRVPRHVPEVSFPALERRRGAPLHHQKDLPVSAVRLQMDAARGASKGVSHLQESFVGCSKETQNQRIPHGQAPDQAAEEPLSLPPTPHAPKAPHPHRKRIGKSLVGIGPLPISL